MLDVCDWLEDLIEHSLITKKPLDEVLALRHGAYVETVVGGIQKLIDFTRETRGNASKVLQESVFDE